MIVSRGLPQRPSMLNQRVDPMWVMTNDDNVRNNESNVFHEERRHTAPIDGSNYQPSSISLLEQDDEESTKGELSFSSPRRRTSRRSVHRTASAALIQNEEQTTIQSWSSDPVEAIGPKSPRRRPISRGLQRAASVSVLSTSSTNKGRTRTLVRAQSKRNVSSSLPIKKTARVVPRRCASADGSLEMLHRLESLSEAYDDDDSNNGTEDLCSITSDSSIDDPKNLMESEPLVAKAKAGSLSSGTDRVSGSLIVSSSRRKPSSRKCATTSKPRSLFGSNHNVMEERILSLQDELVKARSLIESLQEQQQQMEHSDGREPTNDSDSDMGDDASAYDVHEITKSGRKFGKILGGVLGGCK